MLIYNGDTNPANGLKDDAEFSIVPTSGISGTDLVYKALDTDLLFNINQLKPSSNGDAGTYIFKSRAYVDWVGGSEAFAEFTV